MESKKMQRNENGGKEEEQKKESRRHLEFNLEAKFNDILYKCNCLVNKTVKLIAFRLLLSRQLIELDTYLRAFCCCRHVVAKAI